MPRSEMNAKGKIRSNGAQLARYLMTGEQGEIAQLLEARGLDAFGSDPVAAFAMLERLAEENTRCEKAFFHGHVRLAPGEDLADAQWMKSLNRMEKRLGFAGQPRIASFHIDAASGERHLHCGWFRVDLESMRAIDPGLYKNHLVQLARTLEKEFSLREVSSRRQPHDKARAAERDEYEESKRLGTDVRATRTAILDCLEHSDNGKAFKAALEARGMMLANGDRRDCFVVIDQAGGHHALNKKLTGQTLAQTRDRLADLDRGQLPGVEQAQAMQRDRLAEREAGRREPPLEIERQFGASRAQTTEAAAPIFDRDAASRAADERIIDAAIKQAATAAQEARQRRDLAPEVEKHGRGAEPAQAPPQAWEPDAIHELEATAQATVDRAAHAGEGVLRGLGKIFASFIGWLADSIAPPPPPTRDQAERMAWSAEEKQEARAEQAAQAEREAQHWLIVEAQQKAAREREEAAENEQWHARRREQDRGYERER
jgi:hypothetical protein